MLDDVLCVLDKEETGVHLIGALGKQATWV